MRRAPRVASTSRAVGKELMLRLKNMWDSSYRAETNLSDSPILELLTAALDNAPSGSRGGPRLCVP